MGSRRGKKDVGRQDTAKDIILGMNPSGAGPRQAREGRAVGQNGQNGHGPQSAKSEPNVARPERGKTPQTKIASPIAQAARPDAGLVNELQRLNGQMQGMHRAHQDSLTSEQMARRRLEEELRRNQQDMNSMRGQLSNAGSVGGEVRKGDLDDVRRRFVGLEANVMRMQQDVMHAKGMVDRHTNDLQIMNNELKSRPAQENGKVSEQMLDGRMRELHGQLMGMRQQLDKEISERRGGDSEQGQAIQRLQAILHDSDSRKNLVLRELAHKGDLDTKTLNEEARRLNDKIGLITGEVTKNMLANEARLREECLGKYAALEKSVKNEMDARLTYESDVRRLLDERWRAYGEEVEGVKETHAGDKAKNKERFQKINEALAVLERHLEQSNKKIGRVVAGEASSRKLHEKGLLSKLTDVEDRLAAYLGGINQAIEDAGRGKATAKLPTLDFDAVRREMDAIAADKHKLSMEGLLKLEEKMSRVERGLDRDSKELKGKLTGMDKDGGMDGDTLSRLRQQLRRLDDMQEDIEKSHEKLKDRVERQIPEDLDELAQKVENSRRQLHDRVDKEENERYLAIREMQDEISKLRRGGGVPVAAVGGQPSQQGNPALQQEVDETKIAIKKLAESVTVVKNVLDRKLNDETRARERDVARLNGVIEGGKAAGGKKK